MATVPSDRKGWFKMKRGGPLSLLMASAATFFGIERHGHRFYYQGEVLKAYETPEGMAMGDDDLIEMDYGPQI